MSREKSFKELISGQRRGWLPSCIRCVLWIFSFPYGWIVAWRNRRFDRGINVGKADVPVISIGNLTTGGTGKTPLVCYVSDRLRALNLRVTILSRGYGANEKGVNDEALELEIRLPDVPHLQDPDRKKTANIATEELEAQVLLLDDGFQHRKLDREFDLLVVDATTPFGYDYLLPRGLLREPVKNLARADAVVINRCNLVASTQLAAIKQQILKIAPDMAIVEAISTATTAIDFRGQTEPLETFTGNKALAFCGIGNPRGFASTLEELEVELLEPLKEFPDHHLYSREDIEKLQRWVGSQPDCDVILCTHKDLVKIGLHQIAGKPLRAILISVDFQTGEQLLWEKIKEKIPFEAIASDNQ